MEIHKAIQEGIARKRLMQNEVAKKMGVTKTAISKWVSGASKPDAIKLIEIIKFLEIHDLLFPETMTREKDDFATLADLELIKEEIRSGKDIFSELLRVTREDAVKESRIIALEKEIQELKQMLKAINPA